MSALLDLILILVAAVFAILAGAALLGAGAFLVASLGRRRKAHNAATLHLFAEIEQRAHQDLWSGTDLMPLSEGDRALIELGGEPTYRPGDRILLASGRIVTGWELAQLAPDLVTVEQSGDVDNFMAEELARCPKFREAYTALAPDDDLMVVADAVAEDPQPTLHEERIPVPARPNELGGWVRIGDERVHRSCEQAYPAGLVCKYCLPILLVHARSVTP